MFYFALPVMWYAAPRRKPPDTLIRIHRVVHAQTECQSALYCLYYFPSKDLIKYENLLVTLDFSSIFYFRKVITKVKYGIWL